MDIATRSLECLAQIDPDGCDVLPHVWDASETVPLPEAFWDLLDRAQHVLNALLRDQPEAETTPSAALTLKASPECARCRPPLPRPHGLFKCKYAERGKHIARSYPGGRSADQTAYAELFAELGDELTVELDLETMEFLRGAL
ncbi:hypothetical protein AB0D91_45520 [Streptomyces canus]|uniref:hypothetical protein n=1 Tax=Streptomyces canus TaxID=58343 RepID=UPI00340975BD